MQSNFNVSCFRVKPKFNSIAEILKDDSDLKLFKVNIPTYFDLVTDFLQFLSSEEIERSKRYYSPRDKNRFIICRTLLKFIIANQTGLEVKAIKIKKGANKKPYLVSLDSLNFNVSHSENFAIIAISDRAIGVDVEYINRNFDFSDILAHTFSDDERQKIRNSENSKEAFYSLWTRKEAFVKATGKGISDNFSQIPSIEGAHLTPSDILGNLKNLNVFSFDLDKDYKSSIAYDGMLINSNELNIYNLPNSFNELLAFSKLKLK
ncbi:4'-phosphopantetheinyl transferase family protein [Winogradskyella sp. PE311]|uniref:4'-phosphopantetheinyl transferase family protein n=1 Tax=Winogradskyella sp. PE311 TaxID=3366943 RepID=UPI003980DF55